MNRATTSANATYAPPPNTEQVQVMVLARLGVAATLVHIGWEQAQLQKARAKRAPWENIQALPMCWPVLRGVAVMLVHIGREQAQQ